MIGRFLKLPAIAASGLPGTPSVFTMERSYAIPISKLAPRTNIAARTPLGWTQNPLAPAGNSSGLIGNGFDGSNV